MATWYNPVKSVSNTLLYTDTTAKDLFELPGGAIPLRVTTTVTTAFNGSGTDLVDIGISGTANKYANDVDVSSAGTVAVVPLSNTEPLTVATTIQGIYVDSAGDASTGAATIIMEYLEEETVSTKQPEILYTVMSALAITDTDEHLSDVQAIEARYAGAIIYIENGLTQNVTVKVYGAYLAAASTKYQIGSDVTVTAATDYGYIKVDENWPYLLVGITAADVATGSITVKIGPFQ